MSLRFPLFQVGLIPYFLALYLLFLECNTFIMTDVVFDGETTITLNLICISSCVCVYVRL